MATKATPKPWIVFLIFPLLILICEIAALSVGQSSVEQYQLESRGEITEGTAFFTEYQQAGRSGGAYYVRYNFDHNGIRHRGDWKVSEGWVHATKLPAKIRVQFLPDAPAINRPVDVGVHTPLVL